MIDVVKTVVVVNKSDLMRESVLKGRGHECFEHSEEGLFDITLMREWAHASKLEPHFIDLEAVIGYIENSRVYDPQRIDDLTMDEALFDPALVVLYQRPDGDQHLYIDGTHRALKLWRNGQKRQLVFIIPEERIIRPDLNKYGSSTEVLGKDWGDLVVDGKIVKREQL